MNTEQMLQTFLDESRELLSDMERILLELESAGSDPELRNALFRCVHTVKGSAGMFGLDHVVSFTHVVENVLDRLRAEEIQLDGVLANLLLRSRDHISLLVEIPDPAEAGSLGEDGEALLRELTAYQAPDLAALTVTADAGGGDDVSNEVSNDGLWHISIRIHADALKHGMDPLSFIRYLGTLGELVSVIPLWDAQPALDALDSEACFLGFELDLRADTDKATIEGVFEFAADLYELRILPPHSAVADYMALIHALPEAPDRIGEILVASGVLTRSELEQGLRVQAAGGLQQEVRPIGEILVEEGMLQPELVAAGLGKQEQVRERKNKAVQHIRVQADRLDSLINLVGELVIASAAVELNAGKSSDVATRESAAVLALLVEEIRDHSLDLRMVPIGETFQRFQRVVRDVSAELGKDIQLLITGADTELDKTVVEKIGDPLTHLVRNACDHGIESPAARLANGKPAGGSVRLNAYHESGSIIIEVSDDGAGLDRDRILAKAVERGLVKADVILADQEVFNLIFEPGFSTAAQVTNLSGRGVGMDVVRRNIEALRGMVQVVSGSQQGGTMIRIRLPLTLAIIDGFLAKVGDATYVVPLAMVVECSELSAAQQRECVNQHYINLRGEVLPFIRLREHFQLSGNSGRRQNIIVVRHAGQKIGLVVDDLLGEHQTVIKPLSGIFAHLKGLSGSTILGSGQVALILDVPALIPQISAREQGSFQQQRNQRVTAALIQET